MLSFFFTHSAFVRELTVNDNNVNDTNLSCHICISIYFIYACMYVFSLTQLSSMGAFFQIRFWKLKLLLFHISLYHFSFRPNYYSLLPFYSGVYFSLSLLQACHYPVWGSYCCVILSWAYDHLKFLFLFVYLFVWNAIHKMWMHNAKENE